VCAVVYKRRPRRLGHRRGPRRMAVVVRAVDASGKAAITCDEPLAAMYRQGTAAADAIVVLENKAPKWSSASMAYMLDFGGRVTEASSKNFQLISLDCDSYVAVQFGKTGPDAYALDWRFPVSPLMAFGVAVSIMVRKNMRVL
ncbi:Tubby- protein 2, partial [Coemansia sp. RSA 1933]